MLTRERTKLIEIADELSKEELDVFAKSIKRLKRLNQYEACGSCPLCKRYQCASIEEDRKPCPVQRECESFAIALNEVLQIVEDFEETFEELLAIKNHKERIK